MKMMVYMENIQRKTVFMTYLNTLDNAFMDPEFFDIKIFKPKNYNTMSKRFNNNMAMLVGHTLIEVLKTMTQKNIL